MKTGEKRGLNKFIMAVLIILIMMMSFGFRYLVNREVNNRLGEAYIDPESGVPYLTEMDSYYHLRMTRDIEVYGHAGETLKDGEQWDALSYAPYGRSADNYRPLMAYIAVFAYRILSTLGSVTLEQVAYWQGAIISALVVIPVFILAYRMQGMIAAVTASVLSAINYGYFVHTVPGFFDTDMVISWTSCFLFCFGCLLVSCLDNENPAGTETVSHRRLKVVIYAVLFGLSLLLLIGSWYIYYMFAVIFAGAVVLLVILRVVLAGKGRRMPVVRGSAPMLVFFAVLCIAVFITKPDIISNAIGNIKGVFSEGKGSIFPNALISVSEMRKPSLIAGGLSGLFQMRVLSDTNIGIINAVGGMIPCLAALTMCVMLIIRIIKKDVRFEYILFIIWFLITAVLAVRSWRFIMLFAVPVAILAGMFAGSICSLMSEKKMMDWKIFAGMIIALMLFPTIYGAYRSSADSMPSVNRGMHDTLTYIRDNTDEDTILAGWWDYGYFFEEKAVRRTLFDGGSQNGARIYWVARAFATKDETLSANIFRMIAGSGNDAVNRMLEVFGEDKETLGLMDELLSGDRETALTRLKSENIGSEEADELASLLFPDVEEDVLCIITAEMPGVAGWFARFGYPDEEDRYSDDAYAVIMDHEDFVSYDGKAGWQIARDDGKINLIIENEDGMYNAYTTPEDSEDEKTPVDRLLIAENGTMREYRSNTEPDENTPGFVVFVQNDLEVPQVTVVTSLMADSVFGRLYYLGGSGLERYTSIDNVPGNVALYRIE